MLDAGAEADFKAKLGFEGLDGKPGTEDTEGLGTKVQNQPE